MIVDDGYHLSNEGIVACAREIATHFTQTIPTQERNVSVQDQTCIIDTLNTTPNLEEKHNTETIETTAVIAGRIIGQGASTIKRIKAKHQDQIAASKERRRRKFQTEGHKQSTQRARHDISRITSETARGIETKHRKRTACMYFENGYCRMDRQWQFLYSYDHSVGIPPRIPRELERGTERKVNRQWNPRPSTSQRYRQEKESWPRLESSQESEGDSDNEQEDNCTGIGNKKSRKM